ncbi:MAG: hypothetical protein KF889_25485 [Alphaproteobacteria bacterium]|nr:hypothetical protein [Alphaproteobacteria bacterium]MCW5739652.1 hypothetical protein [Alphaproteobacteria bacterium]
MKALALDISTSVGFAVGGPAAAPIFGTHKLPRPADPEDFGGRFAAFDLWLGEAIELHKPTLIAFESPIPPRGQNLQTMWLTVRLLIGLVSIAEMGAAHAGVDCEEVAVPTWKKSFTGSGRADKHQVMARCRQLGILVRTDHEGDAIGILSHVLHAHGRAPGWDRGLGRAA